MRYIKVLFGLLFLICMSLLPLNASQFFGRCFGNLLWRFKTSRSYSVSKANIDCCFPSYSVAAKECLLRSSLRHTAMSYSEMGMSWLWSSKRSLSKVTSVHGEDILRAAIDEGRGVLIIAPHIGNWEILNLYVSQKYDLTVLYKQPKIKFFDWFIKKMRGRLGGTMAPANASGVRQLIKKLRANKIVAILPDQEPAIGSGQFVPFFSRPAYTMTLLSQLASKTNCKVITGVAIRQTDANGFAIRFSSVNPNINSKDLSVSLATLNFIIEEIANSNPEQYQWEYKRFKKVADGDTSLY